MDPISRTISLGAAGAAGGEEYWLAYDSSARNGGYYDLHFDSDGNVYAAGYTEAGTSLSAATYNAKYTSSGSRDWHYILDSTGNQYCLAAASDSSNNLYSLTTNYADSTGVLSKRNSSGTLVWQKKFNYGTISSASGIAIDESTGDIYVTANYEVYQFNSSGTLEYTCSVNDYNFTIDGLYRDSSGKVYVHGYRAQGGNSIYVAYICKLSSVLLLDWFKGFGDQNASPAYGVYTVKGMHVNSNGDVYAVGYYNRGTINNVNYGFLVKLASDGTIQWSKYLGDSNGQRYFGLTSDSSGNLYAVGSATINSVNHILIVKYNSSGVVQWQRAFGNGSNCTAESAVYDSTKDILYVCGSVYAPSKNAPAVLKVPGDGSLTGTYGSFTYQAVNITNGSVSFYDYESFPGTPSRTASSSNSSLTNATSTLSANLVTF